MYRIKVTNPRRPGAAYRTTNGFLSCPEHSEAYSSLPEAVMRASLLLDYLAEADEVFVEEF